MTSSIMLLAAAGTIAAVAYVIIAFMQCLFHTAIFSGCGMALFEINSVAPTDIEMFAMAALLAVIGVSMFRAWQGFKDGLKRVGMA